MGLGLCPWKKLGGPHRLDSYPRTPQNRTKTQHLLILAQNTFQTKSSCHSFPRRSILLFNAIRPYRSARDMMSIISSHHCNWSTGAQSHVCRGRCDKIPCSGNFILHSPYRGLIFSNSMYLINSYRPDQRQRNPIVSSTVNDGQNPDNSEGESSKDESSEGVDSQMLKENLERLVGADDSAFSGMDLATLIRNKYGRSYDVQLIKKEFMGKNFLALNVMWKYVEQKSFPLTEEEYILRLDDVANTLRCWGAVSHIRNSLAKLKERPRIGKAVSIFIDMDESGGRANEWIYK